MAQYTRRTPRCGTDRTSRPFAMLSQEYKIHNAELLFKEDATVDDLIDVIEGNRRCGHG